MSDMRAAIAPKSDQLNADDLIIGTITIKITRVVVKDLAEQKVSVFFEGDNGKPFKPCKLMCRIMTGIWGGASQAYVGHSMTLFRDGKVKWSGLEVGGIRISHMTGINESKTIILQVSKGVFKPYTVHPLAGGPTIQSSTPPVVAPVEIDIEPYKLKMEELSTKGYKPLEEYFLSLENPIRDALKRDGNFVEECKVHAKRVDELKAMPAEKSHPKSFDDILDNQQPTEEN